LDDARHRHQSEDWLSFYARELLLYFPDGASRTLELGCGNGDLYPYIAHRCATYLGVDFSPAMLRRFRAAHQGVALACADAADLPLADRALDCVFSNGVCQYLDPPMLRRNLDQVRALLAPSGVYLIGNIPDAELRWHCYAGALGADREVHLSGLLRRLFERAVLRKPDEMGRWYSRAEIGRLARARGYDCRTFSSASYEYRFHAMLRPRAEDGARERDDARAEGGAAA